MSHAHPERGWNFECGCHERKRADGECGLWRLVGLIFAHHMRQLLNSKSSRSSQRNATPEMRHAERFMAFQNSSSELSGRQSRTTANPQAEKQNAMDASQSLFGKTSC